MMPPTSLALAGLLLLLPAAPQDGTGSAAKKARTFAIDSTHSTIVFSVKHMGVAPFYGRFNKLEGSITYDAESPESSKVSLAIAAESIDTNNEKRDTHLKSPDFFDAKQFKTITFESTAVKKGDKDGTYSVTGDLTLHGVKKEITLTVEKGGETPGRAGTKIGFAVAFSIKRSDFGMKFMLDRGLGDDVQVWAGIEGDEGGGRGR
jgi:polyisoprenoid-binding protein YceI